MGRPKGEPTTVVRVPTSLVEQLQPEASRLGVSVGQVIARRLGPRVVPPAPAGRVPRCKCEKPDPTPYGVCKACGLRR